MVEIVRSSSFKEWIYDVLLSTTKGERKDSISLSDIMAWFFQILSVQQLYRLSSFFWDDKYNTRSVSPDVSLFVRISSVMLVILNLVK